MNAVVLSLLLGATSPTTGEAPAAAPNAVTVRVTSVLGSEDDDQVREVVSERVESVLQDKGFTSADRSPRLLLIRVGRSEETPTDYEVQLSAARNTESAPSRVETFRCSCSAPELLDELDKRLAAHLPTIFEDPEPEPDQPPAPPPPRPEPAIATPAANEQARPWPAHHDTPLFAAGVATIPLASSILIASAIGIPLVVADDELGLPKAAYAAPAIGVAGIVAGAIMLGVNKKRHGARVTSFAPLSGRF